MQFIHLHGHSYFSNMISVDALCSPEEIVEQASELGFEAIALTDHGSVTGIPKFVKACEEKGIKPIVGTELYVCDDQKHRNEDGSRDYQHVVAIAKNWDGLIELFGLLTDAHKKENFHHKPRNSYGQLYETKNLIFTTACGGGVLKRDDWQKKVCEMYSKLPDRFYLEIQPHYDDWQHSINEKAILAHDKLNIPLVATQDFHYAKSNQNIPHEIALAIGSKSTWNDPKRWKYPVNDLYIKTTEEMAKAFQPHIKSHKMTVEHVVKAIKNTKLIADQTDFKWQSMEVSLPHMSDNPEKDLASKCVAKAKERGLLSKEYTDRLKYEFDVLKDSGFITYFLLLENIVDWAKKQGIAVGPGRGSAAGSLVSYLLGITSVDPLIHGLLFERFYRPGRIDLPDIDIDFEDERREEVIDYIRDTWGEEYVSNVCTYTISKAKGAITDVGRVFDVNHFEIKNVTTKIDNLATDDEVFEDQGVVDLMAKHSFIGKYAESVCGFMRGTGQHAAGIVVAGVPLAERGVVDNHKDRPVICWDKRIIEEMGLMKLDVLGLRTLSILRNAVENVKKSRGIDIDLENIPLDDPSALKVFNEGQTVGVFQFESPGMRQLLKGLNVDNFSVIVDATALYRPGPMELIPVYQQVQIGNTKPVYDHPILENILSDTSGILIYQEQLMRVFVDVAGFTYAEADKMRKIVSKSLGPSEFAKHEGDFVDGAIANGLDELTAKNIFKKMISFASYSFNKSHAVAYSILSFQCAYMKANFPAEFFAAHISNSSDDQAERSVEEAKKHGVKIIMPDVNSSDAFNFTVFNDSAIQAPLCAIKGVGEKAANAIVEARRGLMDHQGLRELEERVGRNGAVTSFSDAHIRSGDFTDHKDFLNRIYKRLANAKVQRLLEETGTLPWSDHTEDEIKNARKQYLGHIFQEIISVDTGETLTFDNFSQRALEKQFQKIINMAKDQGLTKDGKLQYATPNYGATPKIMLVFEKTYWPDFKRNYMGNSDDFLIVKKYLKEELGITRKSLYVTAMYKTMKPPVGYEVIHDECLDILKEEINILKPPVIMAFGSGLCKFFAGKDARVNEKAGKTVMYNDIPVVICTSPWIHKNDPTGENVEKFKDAFDRLSEIYQ